MDALRLVLGVVTTAVTVVAIVLMALAVIRMVRVIRLGQPAPGRTGPLWPRLRTTLVETLGHTRMLKWQWVGVAHWFVMVGFVSLVFTLVEAHGEVWDPHFELPWLGSWTPYGLLTEIIATVGLVSIVGLSVYRQIAKPSRRGRASRFENSTMWQAYYVEATITTIFITVLAIRGLRVATGHFGYPVWATPVSHALGAVLPPSELAITLIAALKILVSWVFFIVIARQLTMGVAWHRFTAFFNIYFKREDDGGQALGPAQPMMSKGEPLDFEEADPDEDVFGAGRIEDFSWKGMLDFTTCTECGRCQSQCPAWNTGKPLSPKKVILDLRDHLYAKAPYLTATEEQRAELPSALVLEAERPLVGADNGVIHPDELWACTNCGACVEQCPVDIEHIDHILDMRRFQVMIESDFPSEAGTMLKNLENKGNPWGLAEDRRLDWIQELAERETDPIEVPVVDGRLDDDVEYLFWVGCAGALEDRAKKTTKAIAELLHLAGVKFAVLGPMEACSGDPARRLGMEFVFQMLAQQNVETLNEAGATKIVASCPHCFNTLSREYPQLGGEYDVIHHSQLLARLVEEGRLTPVTPIEENITYHDPCFLGRHNKVYTPPRDIMAQVPGVRTQEMHRCKERGFCCGAGGARMWMEERIGKRINTERVDEALGTDPDTISTACPFCQVMLGDAVNAKKSEGAAKESLEVVDVAQLLVRSVRGEPVPAAGATED
ncbi:(Fe-S)-binding protein [Allonocardiopsis opalescens]|uniref:Fe-S oxidoreductase n=1 Tax=Allonocardiopsis opalescens TaxID=1144618 RepID=A0A2T0PT88_9ACTN|nr:(Fe-S)-binding protein [Allonocardiopsis opalescens]PRX92114.1 Fe-S oxidoreductase [Allonocardiopsis opalescens]